MFRKRSLQVKMVKDSPGGDIIDTDDLLALLEQANKIIKEQTPRIAIAVGAIFVGLKVLDTACQIAIIRATPR